MTQIGKPMTQACQCVFIARVNLSCQEIQLFFYFKHMHVGTAKLYDTHIHINDVSWPCHRRVIDLLHCRNEAHTKVVSDVHVESHPKADLPHACTLARLTLFLGENV